MNRRLFIVLMLILVVSIFGYWYIYLYSKPMMIREDFESGLGGWVADADLPLDPNNPGHFVEWNITRVTGVAHSGQYSMSFFIDGRQDDGTIWIERKIGVRKNTQIQVDISFELYSEHESFNTIAGVCMYAGVRNPEVEDDFVVLGPANEVAGWKKYTYKTVLQTGSSEEVWVAVGITVRWEAYMTYHVDDAEIEIR